MKGKRYTVIYRTGGRENYKWCRIFDRLTGEQAKEKAEELRRMGYPALIHDAVMLEKIGLPETFAPGDAII